MSKKIFLLDYLPKLIYFITSYESCLFSTDVYEHPVRLLWIYSVNRITVSTQFCEINSLTS